MLLEFFVPIRLAACFNAEEIFCCAADKNDGQRSDAVAAGKGQHFKCRQVLGANDLITLNVGNNLAVSHTKTLMREFGAAAELQSEMLAANEARDPNGMETPIAAGNLARAHSKQGKHAEAEELHMAGRCHRAATAGGVRSNPGPLNFSTWPIAVWCGIWGGAWLAWHWFLFLSPI